MALVTNADELDDEALQSLFSWIDSIPLSRKKKNLTRDFSDGCKLFILLSNKCQLSEANWHNYI